MVNFILIQRYIVKEYSQTALQIFGKLYRGEHIKNVSEMLYKKLKHDRHSTKKFIFQTFSGIIYYLGNKEFLILFSPDLATVRHELKNYLNYISLRAAIVQMNNKNIAENMSKINDTIMEMCEYINKHLIN